MTSLWNHRLSDKTGEVVLKEGMPLLLEAYARHNIKATFFYTGDIARMYPEIVKMILPYGHEVACHGLTHESDKAFDVLSLREQIDHLAQSKDILESISGHRVTSFRAPALRVNEFTPQALAQTGFLVDSSVAPQRVDMFLSFGSKKKLKWLTAPRKPYFTKPDDLSKSGSGEIFEIPVSSFLLPYAGTIMRISPLLARFTRSVLNIESGWFEHPLLFLIHPNELIEETIEIKHVHRRGKNYLAYLLGDKLRYQLKLKNLGRKALPLLVNQLDYLSKKNFSFITCQDYYHLKTTTLIHLPDETISQKS
jgi:hypothetical protein